METESELDVLKEKLSGDFSGSKMSGVPRMFAVVTLHGSISVSGLDTII